MRTTAGCPLCGCLHTVTYFEGKESDEQRCLACKGYFHFVRPTKAGGEFTTRQADRMSQPEQPR